MLLCFNIVVFFYIMILCFPLFCKNRYQFRCSDEGKPDSRRKIVRSPSFVKSLPVQVYEIDEKGKLSEQV